MQTRSIYIVLAFVCLCFQMSCGPAPSKSGMPEIAELPPSSSTSTQQSTAAAPANTSLPERELIEFRSLQLMESLFRNQLNINRLDDLYGTTKQQISRLSIISNCNLNVLKAFVAQGWAPVVLVQYGNKRHLWAMIGYDDITGFVNLGNPATTAARNIVAEEFVQEWVTGSGQKCILITPGLLRPAKVQSTLEKYGLAMEAKRVSVRSR